MCLSALLVESLDLHFASHGGQESSRCRWTAFVGEAVRLPTSDSPKGGWPGRPFLDRPRRLYGSRHLGGWVDYNVDNRPNERHAS